MIFTAIVKVCFYKNYFLDLLDLLDSLSKTCAPLSRLLPSTRPQKITQTIEMKDNATASTGLKVTYHSSCLNQAYKQTAKCGDLRVGDKVTFDITITLTACPKDGEPRRQTIQIQPIGLGESMVVDVEMVCECDCELHGEPASEQCKGHGAYKCGVCECDASHTGKACECEM